jgi:N-methylhydantoinase B
VRRDVLGGYVSRERAREGYGVVLTAAGVVDAGATAAERTRLAQARRGWPVVADERDPYEGERGRHRVLRLAPGLAGVLGLGTGDLLELRGRHPAPLRAWVRLDDAAPGDGVALDALGRRMLGVAPGDAVAIRRLAMPPIPGGLVGT